MSSILLTHDKVLCLFFLHVEIFIFSITQFLNEWYFGSIYGFVLVLQVYETHARLAIEIGDLAEYNLVYPYFDGNILVEFGPFGLRVLLFYLS